MLDFFSLASPLKGSKLGSTTEGTITTSTTSTTISTAATPPEHPPSIHRHPWSSVTSQISMSSSSASHSPIPLEVVTSRSSSSKEREEMTIPHTVSPHAATGSELKPCRISFLSTNSSNPEDAAKGRICSSIINLNSEIASSLSCSYLNNVHVTQQQGALDPSRNDVQQPNTHKTLFPSNNNNQDLSSESSNEDLPHMMSMIVSPNSQQLLQRQPYSLHKSRRKSRSSRRSSSSNSSRSKSSSLSHSLLLDGYDEGNSSNNNRKSPPLAVRRRASQQFDGRRTSSMCTNENNYQSSLRDWPLAAAVSSSSPLASSSLVSPAASSDGFSSDSRRRYSYQHPPTQNGRYNTNNIHHDVSSSSPEMSSESSPDSSPYRPHLIVNDSKQRSQRWYRKQGSFSSTSRLSGSINDPSASIHSNIPTSGGGGSGSTSSMLSFPGLWSFHRKWSTKSWCLAGTFVGMIVVSIMGMVMLTNQAAVVGFYDLEEQSMNRPVRSPSAAGLRGKMVQGKWDDNIINNKPLLPSSVTQKTSTVAKKNSSTLLSSTSSSSSFSSSNQKKTKPGSVDNPTKKAPLKPEKRSNGNTSTKKTAVTVPSRLKMRLPPPMSLPQAKWEMMDPNILGTMYKVNPGDTKQRPLSKHPRIFMLDPSTPKVSASKMKIYPSDFTDNTQLYGMLPSDDERLSRMEIRAPYSDGECVPMQDWQTTFHPYCNGMHELALETLGASGINKKVSSDRFDNLLSGIGAQIFGTHGFWRYAWKVTMRHFDKTHSHPEQDTVVLKTLKYEHNFEDAHFEHDRVDAVAMERLTSSPHVINIFGFCGHSVLTEYADGTRVGALADKARKKPLERLRIARDIANGLADVHGIDGDGNATFVHLDVNPANVVSVGGTLKLNDFNIGIIRRWNTTSNQPCGFPAQYPNPQWRSPEEARNEQNLTEKVDIFSMGHIFFRLICGHEPWNKLEPGGKPSKEDINYKVQRGELPFIPDHVQNSKNPEVIAIRNAMLSCYQPNPKDRPSARDIANKLDVTLKELSHNPPSVDDE
jgi:hypothetical protein